MLVRMRVVEGNLGSGRVGGMAETHLDYGIEAALTIRFKVGAAVEYHLVYTRLRMCIWRQEGRASTIIVGLSELDQLPKEELTSDLPFGQNSGGRIGDHTLGQRNELK